SGGTPTAVVTGLTVPLNLSLDTNDGLVFFVENNGIGHGINKLEVGNLSTPGAATVLNSQLSATVQAELDTNPGQLTGVAVDATNNVLYFTAVNGANTANNFIFSVPYTVSAGSVTLGSVTTLYSGAAAGGLPGPIAIDPVAGVFYVGDRGNQAIDSGSLTGSGPVTQIYQLTTTTGVQPKSLFFLSTPTVTVSGGVTFLQGNSPVVLASGISIANPDGQNLGSATVVIAGGTAANGETLAATTTGTSITASY